MNTFAHSLADFLEENGIGERGKNLFIDNLPQDYRVALPVITIYNTPSYAVANRARNSVNFTCQVRVRASKSANAYELIDSIYKLVYNNDLIDSNNKKFYFKQPHPPQFLLFDENNRANWVLNLTALSENY